MAKYYSTLTDAEYDSLTDEEYALLADEPPPPPETGANVVIQHIIVIKVSKGPIDLAKQFSKQIVLAGEDFAWRTREVGTTHGMLDLGDVADPGIGFFRNHDDANFIEIGIDEGGVFVPLIKLMPGEAATFRLATNQPYARADTATSRLEYMVIED